jgi:hypothetical protein
MSFILDPTKNSALENVIPSGTSDNPSITMTAPVLFEQSINTGSESSFATQRFLRLDDDKTEYTMQPNDDIVEVASMTYLSIYLPVPTGMGGKKYTILRSFGGETELSIISTGELIDGSDSKLVLTQNNQHVELLSNDNAWNST